MPGGPRLPKPLRPLVGSVVLVGTVRVVDALWRRMTGHRPPAGGPDATDTSDARVLRERLVYALLLGAALRLARRAGLTDADT
jgi:hypothetical protein